MYHQKLIHLIFFVLLAYSNAGMATVYDFGSVKSISRYQSSQSVSMNSDTSMSPSYPSRKSLNGSKDSDSDRQSKLGNDESADNQIAYVEYINNGQYDSVISPIPEPQTYAMILAGLCLIGLTIRRKKQDP